MMSREPLLWQGGTVAASTVNACPVFWTLQIIYWPWVRPPQEGRSE